MTKQSLRVTDELLEDYELMGLIIEEEIKEEGDLMSICIDCQFILDLNKGFCNNPELPITDYVYGTRDCNELNPKGACMGFKPKSDDESIYELKGDEELAKTE